MQRAAKTADVGPPQVIDQEDDNIGPVFGSGIGGTIQQEQREVYPNAQCCCERQALAAISIWCVVHCAYVGFRLLGNLYNFLDRGNQSHRTDQPGLPKRNVLPRLAIGNRDIGTTKALVER